ncbi:MAG: hypothetical protein R3B47_15250 [Bacteroidia bacterium]
MRPFKMFFGIAIAVMLFLFVARIALIAFVVAAVMTVMYAAFKGLKSMAGYDRGRAYYAGRHFGQERSPFGGEAVEPLFHDIRRERPSDGGMRYVETM